MCIYCLRTKSRLDHPCMVINSLEMSLRLSLMTVWVYVSLMLAHLCWEGYICLVLIVTIVCFHTRCDLSHGNNSHWLYEPCGDP